MNVFLGLGLPWVIATIYAYTKDVKYTVATGNLTSSVVIFTICGTICIILLLIRRKVRKPVYSVSLATSLILSLLPW